MKRQQALLVLVVLYLSLSLFARADGTVTSTTGTLNKVLNFLPEGETKRGLKEYSQILGMDKYGNDGVVGGGNFGISEYFSSRFGDKNNSCVRDAAKNFYGDVAAYLKNKGPEKCAPAMSYAPGGEGHVVASNDYGCSSGRALLSEAAGAGKFKDYEQGWVWKLALKNANGDPNAAMFLIGMCGHDDVSQGNYRLLDKSVEGQDKGRFEQEQAQDIIRRKQSRLDSLKAQHLDTNEAKKLIEYLQAEVLKLKSQVRQIQEKGGVVEKMNCPPQDSGYYSAKSLAADADIPDSTKRDLQEAFSTDNAKNTSSKYYHVYGSAFMACQLVQNGFSAQSASLLQQQAARAYRGMRMCSSTSTLTEGEENQKKIQKEIFAKYNVSDDFSLGKIFMKDRKKIKDCQTMALSSGDKTECDYVVFAGIPIYSVSSDGEFKVTDEDIRKSIQGRIKNVDAAKLYKSWYLGGGEVAGKKIPCTDLRVLGPSDLKNPTESFFGRLAKPAGWSDERYNTASKKLSTWDQDYKWTVAQHKAGADFAGKVCKKRDAKEKPLAGICPKGPPSGTAIYDYVEGIYTVNSDTNKKSTPIKPAAAVK